MYSHWMIGYEALYRIPHSPQTVTLGGPLSQPNPSSGTESSLHFGALRRKRM